MALTGCFRVCRRIAEAAGVHPSQVKIKGFSKGSLIVEFEIDFSGMEGEPEADVERMAEQAVSKIKRAAAAPGGALTKHDPGSQIRGAATVQRVEVTEPTAEPEPTARGFAQPTAAASARTAALDADGRDFNRGLQTEDAARGGRDKSSRRGGGRRDAGPSRWAAGGDSAASSERSGSRRERDPARRREQRDEDDSRHRGDRKRSSRRRDGDRSSRSSSHGSERRDGRRRDGSRSGHRRGDGSRSSREKENAGSVSSARTTGSRQMREVLRSVAKDPRRWTQPEVERALAETEDFETELEEERDVLKALQVRLVLEDAARLTNRQRSVMADELERYREYKKYADAGVRTAWDILQETIEDIDNPPDLRAEELRQELQQTTRRVVSLECDSTDVARLLRRSKEIPSLTEMREELEAEYMRVIEEALKALRTANNSYELRQIDAVLHRYESVQSQEIRHTCADLREHRQQVVLQLEGVEELRGRLLRLLDSDNYLAITEALNEAEPYEVLMNERDAVMARRDTLTSEAVNQLRALVDNIDVSLDEVEAALQRHEENPDPAVLEEWDRLNVWVEKLEHIDREKEDMKQRLDAAKGSSDLNGLEQLLAECSTNKYKRELGRQIFEVAERADHLADTAVSQMDGLHDSANDPAITEAVQRWSGCNQPEVRAAWTRLVSRQREVEEESKATDAVRIRLRQLTGTCTISDGVRALKASAALGSAIGAEREQLQHFVTALQDSALEAMQKALHRSYLSMEEAESLLEKYPERDCVNEEMHQARLALQERRKALQVRRSEVDTWRERLLGMINSCRLDAAESMLRELGAVASADVAMELAREHSAMLVYTQQLRTEAIEKLQTQISGREVGGLLSAIADHQDVQDPEVRLLCARANEQVKRLNEEAERVKEWKARLLTLCEGGGIEDVTLALAQTEGMAVDLPTERNLLLGHQRQLLDAAIAALRDMLTSSDTIDIDTCLDDYRSYTDAGVQEASRALRAHRAKVQGEADAHLTSLRGRLQNLVGDTRLADCEAALVTSDELDGSLHFEREALQEHVSALKATARAAMTDMLTSDVLADIEECMADYREVAAGEGSELAELWSKLRARQKRLLEDLRATLIELGNSHDVKALGAALMDAGPYGDVLAGELVVVRKRKADLVDVMRQTLTGLVETGDPVSMEEAIRKAEGIVELTGEVGALSARHAAVLADGKLMLARFSVPSTFYTAEELLQIRTKYEGHSSYFPEEWQMLEQAYHNALAAEGGGAVGQPIGGGGKHRHRATADLSGASFGHTVENSLAAAAELEHANSGLEEMLGQEGERRSHAERSLKDESAKR